MHVSKWPIFSPLIRNKNFENGERGGGGEIPKEGSRDLAPGGGGGGANLWGGAKSLRHRVKPGLAVFTRQANLGRTRVSSVYTTKTNPGRTWVSSIYTRQTNLGRTRVRSVYTTKTNPGRTWVSSIYTTN